MAAPPGAQLPAIDDPAAQSAPDGITMEDVRRALPIAFVVSLVVICHAQFVSQHCAPMIMRPGLTAWGANNEMLSLYLGLATMVVFYFMQSAFLYCYFRCVCTPPGGVPDTSMWLDTPELEFTPSFSDKAPIITERKESSGERRFCRWCAKYKPDRTHHCRQCKTCVRKMDHHCPWVGNCIGFKNHKFFLLCIFYATITVDLAAVVHFVRRTDQIFFTGHESAAILVVVDGVWALLATALTLFSMLHLWLLLHGKTTLEFREKGWNTKSSRSDYDWGTYWNVCAVLGDRPHLWLVPISNSLGDGIDWTPPSPRLRPASPCKLEGRAQC